MIFTMLGWAGGWATLAVGGIYSWAAHVYGYNRDAWMTDVQLRQGFEYQSDNLVVATHEMSREEVRDRTEAAITKLSNYIVVTTLISALAAELLVEGQVPPDSADFILNAYMLCLGSSVTYLVLSILFGIVAINHIYESSAELLTERIPPAWSRIDQKMKSKAALNLVNSFEKRPWRQIFMPPMMRRMGCLTPVEEDFVQKINDQHGDLEEIKRDYTDQFVQREKNWLPLTSQSFLCLALGVKNLLDVYSYLCLAMLFSKFGIDWAFWSVQIIFTTLNVLLMQFLFEHSTKLRRILAVAGGPLFCALAAATPFVYVDRICVPLCYVSHFSLLILFHKDVATETNMTCSLSEPEHAARLEDESAELTVEVDSPGRTDGYEALHIDKVIPLSSDGSDSSSVRSRREALVGNGTSSTRSQPEVQIAGVAAQVFDRQCSPGDASPRGPSGVKGATRRRSTLAVVWQMMFVARSVLLALWFFSICWALNKALFGHGFMNSEALFQMSGPPLAHIRDLTTHWPSPYFSPHALTCPSSGWVFVADQFRVYEMANDDSNSVKPYDCDVNGTIADISADCDSNGCWPMVLLEDLPPRVLECGTGKEYPLLQTPHTAEQFAVVNAYTLLAAHNGQIVEYHWSAHRQGWAPAWIVADWGKDNLQALDVTGRRMLVFRRHFGQCTVHVQDLKTANQCGVWQTPPAILGAGCAEKAGGILKLLIHDDDPTNGAQVRLMEAELEGPQTCDKGRDKESMPGPFARRQPAAYPRTNLRHGEDSSQNNRWLDPGSHAA